MFNTLRIHIILIVAAILFLSSLSSHATVAAREELNKGNINNLIAQASVKEGEAVPAPSDEEIAPGGPVIPAAPSNVPPVPAAPAAPSAPKTAAPPSSVQQEQKMAPVPGQPSAPQPVPPQATPAQPVPAQPAPVQQVPAQPRSATFGGGSSFFFDDADVFEVIQTVFGEVLRVNYVIDPQVKGRVNFRTNTPIPRDKILPVMEIILRLNGIAVVEESGLYRIIQMNSIPKEPAPIRFGKDPNAVQLNGTAILQIVPLTFINSTEMTGILNPMLTQGGSIYDIPKKNILIIADTDANVKRLLQVVSFFDEDISKDTSKPKIYVYPLQNSKAEHVAKILQQVVLGSSVPGAAKATAAPAGAAPAAAPRPGAATPQPSQVQSISSGEALVASGTKIFPDEVTNSLVIFASPADYALILNAIKQIDTIPRQVMIEAVVAAVTLTDNLTFGIRWNMNINVHQLELKPFTKPITAGGPLGFQGLTPLTAGTFGYFATDSSGQVRLAIEALAEQNKAKVLSAPQILVADNREARIQVGKQIPLATSTTTTPLASGTAVTNTTTSTIQYKDTGTILKVKPQVNDSGLISLEISQEVSDAVTTTVLGTDQFVITKNEVSTNLVAQDGQTIVIGGLVTENNTFDRSGIPFLSKIPLLGYLFGETTESKVRQELIILLTPRVIRNPEEAKKMSSDYYGVFKDLGKEIDLEKHKKSLPQAPMPPQQPTPTPAAPVPPAGTPVQPK